MARSLESLDLNLLNVLHWVLQERSTTEAAKRLGVSQPAVSRALGRLREVYGDPLLVKQGRALAPTPLGERLGPLVARAVASMREVVGASEGFDPASATGAFRVAAKEVASLGLVEAWVREVRPHAPGLVLEIRDLEPESARDLVSGRLDLALAPLGGDVEIPQGVDLSQFVIRHVLDLPWRCGVRPGHPLAERVRAGGAVSTEDYAALEHILVNPQGEERGAVDARLRERGLERGIAFRTESFLLAVAILLQTDCVLTLAASLVERPEYGLLTFDPPVELPPLALHGGWHPNWTTDARHSWIRERVFAGLSALRSPERRGAG